MAAYMIARINVTDIDRYNEYIKVTPGTEEKWRIVVIEFPDLQKAKDFYNSADYADAKKIREGAALAQFVAIEGVD
jgi:uncharacterized protein (DUF1330 family)